jgi:hypothetical protein
MTTEQTRLRRAAVAIHERFDVTPEQAMMYTATAVEHLASTAEEVDQSAQCKSYRDEIARLKSVVEIVTAEATKLTVENAKLRSQNEGLAAAADMAYDDVVSLLDNN